jgi:GNAT superfamily N-acetyltransferase
MDPPAPLSVRPVRTRRQWRAFHRVWRDVYRNDPAAVEPLRQQRRLALDLHAHPFYQHAEREAFLCWQGSRPVGRIVAIVDRMHQEHYGDGTGFFGFLELPDDEGVLAELLAAASEWLAQRGCDRLRGPVSPSMKGEFGVQVDGNRLPPYVLMAHTPAYYDRLLLGAGFRPAHDFLVYQVNRAGIMARKAAWDDLGRVCRRIEKRHPELSVRTGAPADLRQHFRDVNRLANRVRRPVWGFVPLTEAELDFLTQQLRRVIDPQLVVTAYRHRELVGYAIALPDVYWALRRTLGRADWLRIPQLFFWKRRIPQARVLAIGVADRYRQTGIAALLTQKLFEAAVPRYEAFEVGWIAEDNVRSLRLLLRVLPLEVCKTYRLYDRPITA